MMRLIAAILLAVCASSACSATDLPAKDYIDITEVEDCYNMPRELLRNLVEEHGSENADETFELVKELSEISTKLYSGEQTLDRYNLMGRAGKSGVYLLSRLLHRMIEVILEPEKNRASSDLAFILDTIKTLFGDDLDGFASGTVSHDAKLRTFLHKYTTDILRRLLPVIFNNPIGGSVAEEYMQLITGSYVNGEALSAAGRAQKLQKMNLVTDDFDAVKMLANIESGGSLFLSSYGNILSTKKRLYRRLTDSCHAFHSVYARAVDVFVWCRLLIPGEMPAVLPEPRLPTWAEYGRVCLPVINKATFPRVAANIKRNMSLTKKIKDQFRSLKN